MKPRIILGLKDSARISNVMSRLKDTPHINAANITYRRLHNSLPSVSVFLQKEGIDSLDQIASEGKEQTLLASMAETERRLFQTYLLEIEGEEQVDTLLQALQAQAGEVDFAERDKLNFTSGVAIDMPKEQINDPKRPQLYGLDLLECDEAWKKSKGESVVVAVVDTGVDYSHPDIEANMWMDEEGNYGYNFVDETNDPMDDQGHGTHVAGSIAAVGNNGLGIIGVAPEAKIMAVKGLNFEGKGYDSMLADCILYAALNGAHIINNSWGRGDSQAISNAIDEAHRQNCIVIFAAGNENQEVLPSYAAGKSNTITVSAIDQFDSKTSFSNFGELVDVSAPGYNILSLRPGGGNVPKNGTSMACPHVSGVVALLLAMNPNLNFQEVKRYLLAGVDPHGPANVPFGMGRVNAWQSIKELEDTDGTSPSPLRPVLTEGAIVGFKIEVKANEKHELSLNLENGQAKKLAFETLTELSALVSLLHQLEAPTFQGNSIVWEKKAM